MAGDTSIEETKKRFDKLPKVRHELKPDWRDDVHRMMGDIDLMQYHTSAMKFQGRGADLNAVHQHLTEMHRNMQQVKEAMDRIEKELGFVIIAKGTSSTASVSFVATDSPVRCTSCNERVGLKKGDYTVTEEDILCAECYERLS